MTAISSRTLALSSGSWPLVPGSIFSSSNHQSKVVSPGRGGGGLALSLATWDIPSGQDVSERCEYHGNRNQVRGERRRSAAFSLLGIEAYSYSLRFAQGQPTIIYIKTYPFLHRSSPDRCSAAAPFAFDPSVPEISGVSSADKSELMINDQRDYQPRRKTSPIPTRPLGSDHDCRAAWVNRSTTSLDSGDQRH